MKVYATVEITKGWDTWYKLSEEMKPEMEAVGMKFLFKGCEMDEKKVHVIMEIESMEVTGIPQNPFKSQEIIEVHEISRNPAPAGSARILRKLETPH